MGATPDLAKLDRTIVVYQATMAVLPYWMIFFSFPTAVLMRAMFPKQQRTVAEYWLMTWYAIGLALLLDAAVSLVVTVTNSDPAFLIRQLSVNILIVLSTAYVGRAWLGGGVWTLLRLCFAILLSYALIGSLQLLVARSYAEWGPLLK